MEVDEQIRIFKEFIERNYYAQLLEAVRKGQNLFQDFQNAGDTDARLAGATKELTKDEQEKAAVAKMSVLMELLQ